MTDTPTTQEAIPKSKFKYGGRHLHELSRLELLESIESIWESKNEEIGKLKAERDGLRQLLASPLPVHTLWRSFADNALLLGYATTLAYLVGKAAA